MRNIEARSINLAAYLLAFGLEMTGTRDEDDGTILFLFQGDDRGSQALANFRRNDTTVNLKDFCKSQKHLRDLLWNKRQTRRRNDDGKQY